MGEESEGESGEESEGEGEEDEEGEGAGGGAGDEGWYGAKIRWGGGRLASRMGLTTRSDVCTRVL
jgi:hypothetical protein